MRKISGVLLALAASLALGATTVAAKDYGDGGGGGGGGEKMQNEGKGGAGGGKCVATKRTAHGASNRLLSNPICCCNALPPPRCQILCCSPPPPTPSITICHLHVAALAEHMKPLARRDAGRCLASLSLSEHLKPPHRLPIWLNFSATSSRR